MPPQFIIESIYISPDAGSPMQRLNAVDVRSDFGLIGDRYESRKGFWQNIPKPAKIGRDVSIINVDDVLGTEFSPEQTRRNIFVRGQGKLTDLIGTSFYEILFAATEECTPCKRPSDLCGKPGFVRALKGKGGIRTRVLNNGRLQVGDALRLLDESPS